jgi:hypothetical protein
MAPALRFAGRRVNTQPASNTCRRSSDRERKGDWNEIEVVCFEGNCVHIANGAVVMI